MASIMDCKKIQPRLSEYIDGATDNDTAWAIQLHLVSCAVCTRVSDDLMHTASLLRDLPQPTLSDKFDDALAMRLADQVLQPRNPTVWDRVADWWQQPRVRPVFASAAALAAVLPVAFVVAYRSGEGASVRHNPAHTVAPTTQMASVPGLDEMWNEHLSYASSEPLADSAGILQAQAARSSTSSILEDQSF